MPSIWTRQPGTAVYTAFFAAFTLLRLPWLCTLYLFPSMRPNCHWTFRQSLGRMLFLYSGKYEALVELKAPPTLEPGTENEGFVIMQPAKSDLYRDIFATRRFIQAPLVRSSTQSPSLIPDSIKDASGSFSIFTGARTY